MKALIGKLKELDKARTQGQRIENPEHQPATVFGAETVRVVMRNLLPTNEADLEFICAAANLMPLLIEDWERQRKLLEKDTSLLLDSVVGCLEAENTKLKELLKRARVILELTGKEYYPSLKADIDQALAVGTTETMEG